MSTNSQVSVQRENLTSKPSYTHSQQPTPIVNDFFSSMNFLNPISVTQAGRYDTVETVPNPIKSWHKASKGATERFSGCLSEMFPELKDFRSIPLISLSLKRHDL